MATEPAAALPVAPSLVDRYFTRWYKADVKGKPCEDHCILQHSNRICVITLAGSHPVLQSGKTIESISYQISTNCSRLQNKVSGKFKRGAQFLTELAPLCKIYCSDGEEYTISSCVRGRLMEVNENILHKPSILQEKENTKVYLESEVLPDKQTPWRGSPTLGGSQTLWSTATYIVWFLEGFQTHFTRSPIIDEQSFFFRGAATAA